MQPSLVNESDKPALPIAIYLLTSSLKGISSMKLHRELEVAQKTAWHLSHRLRKAFGIPNPGSPGKLKGPVEGDETFVGGRRKNMHKSRRKQLTGRGSSGKAIVAGIKDRTTKEVRAHVVADTTADTLQGFIHENVETGAQVYTDEATGYSGLNGLFYRHESVVHSVGEYVRGQAHTNGLESFWAALQRGHTGVYHKMSPKHLDRYMTEFAGRHNIRDFDTIRQMAIVSANLKGKRLKYKDLIKKTPLVA
ncbi:MAG: IS1595 family transposase [Parvularculales bacterium]